MTEICQPKGSRYAHLSQSHTEEMLEIAKALIVEYVDVGVGCVINRSDYARILSEKQRSQHGTDYTLGVKYCVNAIREHLGAAARGTTVSVFLEGGHRNTRQAIKSLKAERVRQQSSFDSAMRTENGAVIWRNPDRDSLGITLGIVDTGTKESMVPLQAADLLAFCVFNDDQKRFLDMLAYFGERFPLLIYKLSTDSLRGLATQFQQAEVHARNQRRRTDTVLREIKKMGGSIRKVENWGQVIDFEEAVKAESQIIRDLGLSPPKRPFASLGEDIPPNGVVVIKCAHCERVYTLRGFSKRLDLFVCPDCGNHMHAPVEMQS